MSVALSHTDIDSDIDFSKEAGEVLHIAARKAEEYLHPSYGPPHLLWALLNRQISTHELIRAWDKDIFYLQEWASVRLEEYPKANGAAGRVATDSGVYKLLMEADQLRFELNRQKVDAVCLLAALCTPGLAFSVDQLKTFSLSREEILADADGTDVPPGADQRLPVPRQKAGPASPDGLPGPYCRDIRREFAQQEQIGLVGRQREIKNCLEILCRYTKANLLITGEPGVGKTALIAGLAEQVEEQNVPVNLRRARLLELDLAALQAGATYKGELEDRFQRLLDALNDRERPILVIEEIHTLLDKHERFSSLANLLAVELRREQLTVIGSTTPENYRKNIENNERFARLFETVTLEEPGDEATADIIRAVIAPYERHHSLQVTGKVIREAIRLSRRYDKNRRLPAAAIDLLDRSMARVRITVNRSQAAFDRLNRTFERCGEDPEQGRLSALHEAYTAFYEVARPLTGTHADLSLEEGDDLDDNDRFIAYMENIIPRIAALVEQSDRKIKPADLARVISGKTGIPAGNIKARERTRLLGMEEVLRERVVGQDAALQSVSEAVLESRSGLLGGGQPVGSFFFMGPTGTGKTELAKALSEFLFRDEKAMIRFDMSEFKEEHSAALLHGAPPGYVGYEEGGLLVNKIRERPYSVVLFDEIEKAHASVFDIFLQILDEGTLSDRLGKKGDFSNAVVLFTSNIGSDYITEVLEKQDQLPSGRQLMEKLSGYFRAEFLGRLTEIVPFAPVGEEALLRIFEIHLKELVQAAGRKGISVVVDAAAKAHLSQLGYSPTYGARPLKGVIRDKIRRPLSRMIIEERVTAGDRVQLSLDRSQQVQWKIN
ncbi:ATP-dependent Clp protease ATP-binding subunit ClpA [Fodinibius roseus]|uniref:ATP-dependent Clp protease ATP-binding subunit ClpA n=1 Tax=Fodinibius roseus TaxID=1194090 RepID=A0A1M5A1G7_9BACT|nr:ATP-dependent Clp protease ATP-binding subunit [Fodinibius roseus]SHF24054.1 ATP-dependent Clp protease ATP-binding subunit ClpA [Fodinibius roseus]